MGMTVDHVRTDFLEVRPNLSNVSSASSSIHNRGLVSGPLPGKERHFMTVVRKGVRETGYERGNSPRDRRSIRGQNRDAGHARSPTYHNDWPVISKIL